MAEGADTVAAFIGEPLMGAGGVIPPPRGYWEKMQAVLAASTTCWWWPTRSSPASAAPAKWWLQPDLQHRARFHGGVEGDHVELLPADRRSCSPIASIRRSPTTSAKIGVFAHGFTASGHPVGTAVALENLDIIEEKDLDRRRPPSRTAIPGAAARLRRRTRSLAKRAASG